MNDKRLQLLRPLWTSCKEFRMALGWRRQRVINQIDSRVAPRLPLPFVPVGCACRKPARRWGVTGRCPAEGGNWTGRVQFRGKAFTPRIPLSRDHERKARSTTFATPSPSTRRHTLVGMLRQSVFGRLAGYEDVNDAKRLRHHQPLGPRRLRAAASEALDGEGRGANVLDQH